jgi:hypothetical protein
MYSADMCITQEPTFIILFNRKVHTINHTCTLLIASIIHTESIINLGVLFDFSVSPVIILTIYFLSHLNSWN